MGPISTMGEKIPGRTLPVPHAWYTGETRTKDVINSETGEKTTVTLGGMTPSECNAIEDKSGGDSSAQSCCHAYKGYWYQDYGIFAPMFPDKSYEYCHSAPMSALQTPLNQQIIIGGTVTGVAALVAVLMMMRRRK